MPSFSSDTKTLLCELPLKRECCCLSVLYGILTGARKFDGDEICFGTENQAIADLFTSLLLACFSFPPATDVAQKRSQPIYTLSVSAEKIKRVTDRLSYTHIDDGVFVCPECETAFIRGCFLSAGFLYPPMTTHRAELTLSDAKAAEKICGLLAKHIGPPKTAKRSSGGKDKYCVYYCGETEVEDFLNLIGAQQSAFVIMNETIFSERRNLANRSTNCVTANIQKSVSAALAQTEAIKKLAATGKLATLPDKLRETARLRIENPESDLSEIAALHDPPISKSGASHRLAKLIGISEDLD